MTSKEQIMASEEKGYEKPPVEFSLYWRNFSANAAPLQIFAAVLC
ncbi:hypothetical protein CVS40_4569 [Lucilia cuprina]|nr:hypothetical protein CVS40_4569 [Lucilia cuprina]